MVSGGGGGARTDLVKFVSGGDGGEAVRGRRTWCVVMREGGRTWVVVVREGDVFDDWWRRAD
jgi:hypothetical protein